MRWDERQVAMLREMGIRLWCAPADDPAPRSAGVNLPVAEAAASVDVGDARVGAALAEPLTREVASVATLDWPALREAVAACTACKLCHSRRQTVFGVGNLRADWMFVGEAPGEQEDRQGEPFVGKSGQLLDNMLRALQLSRREDDPAGGVSANQVYIANTIKCRPPANRNPEPVELATCEPFLVRQVQLVQPKIIVAMGRFAVHSLLRSSEPIGRLRGRVHRYEGVPLIVTYHPAYLLRNPEDKARAWDDLCLAAQTAAAASGRKAPPSGTNSAATPSA